MPRFWNIPFWWVRSGAPGFIRAKPSLFGPKAQGVTGVKGESFILLAHEQQTFFSLPLAPGKREDELTATSQGQWGPLREAGAPLIQPRKPHRFRGQRPAFGKTGVACGSQENLWGQGLFRAHRPVSRVHGLWRHVRRIPPSVRGSAATALNCVIILNADPAFPFLTEPHILCSGCWVLRWPGILSR